MEPGQTHSYHQSKTKFDNNRQFLPTFCWTSKWINFEYIYSIHVHEWWSYSPILNYTLLSMGSPELLHRTDKCSCNLPYNNVEDTPPTRTIQSSLTRQVIKRGCYKCSFARNLPCRVVTRPELYQVRKASCNSIYVKRAKLTTKQYIYWDVNAYVANGGWVPRSQGGW